MFLLLPVFMAFVRAEQLKVVKHPEFNKVYVSDDITLLCKRGREILQSGVTWSHDGQTISHNAILPITMTMNDSGLYKCTNGQMESNVANITVLNMVPKGLLSKIRRKSVIGPQDAVILELYVEEGLRDWWCRHTFLQFSEYWLPLPEQDWSNQNRSAFIHANIKGANSTSTTYWCMNINTKERSNAITLRVTDRIVMLQMLEDPVFEGENVNLSCEVWGNGHVDRAVFYKDGKIIQEDKGTTLVIKNISHTSAGRYWCNATYKFSHISKTAQDHRNVYSDEQVLRIKVGPPAAILVQDSNGLTCTCPLCDRHQSYRWYRTPVGGASYTSPGATLTETSQNVKARKDGVYTCRAILDEGLSRLSNKFTYTHTDAPDDLTWMVVVVVVVVVVVGLCLLLVAWYHKRRSNQLLLGERKVAGKDDGADGGYELIDVRKNKSKEKDEGEYELLKGPQTEVYHTLKGQGEGQGKGEGGYEALKGPQAQVYHTLKGQGEGQGKGEGEGGYEALKGPQAQVYHTLKGQGQTSPVEVHHTPETAPLKGQEGEEAQAEGGYEQLPLKDPEYESMRETEK